METVDLQEHMARLVDQGRGLSAEIEEHVSSTKVHKLRICLRRLRTCLALLDHKLPDKEKKQLKKLWHHLGAVRDLDVVKKLSEDNELPEKDVKKQRKKERHELKEILRDKKTEQLFDELQILAFKKETMTLSPVAAIQDLRKKLVRTPATADHLHDIRILLKKIRYLREAFGLSVDAFKGVQDLFGEFQDFTVLLNHHPDDPEVHRQLSLKQEAVLFILSSAFRLALGGLTEMENTFRASEDAPRSRRQARGA